jgi:hypothetical protein
MHFVSFLNLRKAMLDVRAGKTISMVELTLKNSSAAK